MERDRAPTSVIRVPVGVARVASAVGCAATRAVAPMGTTAVERGAGVATDVAVGPAVGGIVGVDVATTGDCTGVIEGPGSATDVDAAAPSGIVVAAGAEALAALG